MGMGWRGYRAMGWRGYRVMGWGGYRVVWGWGGEGIGQCGDGVERV